MSHPQTELHHFVEQLETHQHPSARHKHLFNQAALDENALPVDVQIQAELEELRHLKYQLTALRTKQIFLQKLRDARIVDDLPTAQQAISAEIELQKMNTELRKTKAQRSSLEQRFENAVRDWGQAAAHHHQAYQSIKHRIDRHRADAYVDSFEKHIQNADWQAAARSYQDVQEIDNLQIPHFRRLTSLLRKEKAKFKAQATDNNPQLQQLHQHVQQLERNVDVLKEKQVTLNRRIEQQERTDVAFSKLRHEFELQKQLHDILPSITGVSVGEIRVNGICFEINAMLFVPFVDGIKREKSTHSLVVKLDENSHTSNNVVELILTPADVQVDDLFGMEHNVSLRFVVQTVCARLAKFVTRNLEEQRTCQEEQ